MNRWIDIDDERYSRATTDYRKGAHPITSITSPYDIPKGVSVSTDPQGGYLVLRFHYLSGEVPSEYKRVNDRLEVIVGERSQRLLAAKINLKPLIAGRRRLTPDEVGNYIESTLAGLKSWGCGGNTNKRTKLPRDIISDHRDRLFSGFA